MSSRSDVMVRWCRVMGLVQQSDFALAAPVPLTMWHVYLIPADMATVRTTWGLNWCLGSSPLAHKCAVACYKVQD